MKTQVKSLFYLLILSIFTILTSCREESDENIFPEEETVLADSEVADLILRTTQKSGSGDDILDGSSCYSVQLPVTITIEDIKIIVETEEDFEKIEDVFEDLDEEIDDLEFVYPITLIAADFTETVVDNEEELEKLLDICEDDDDDDDEIECINFKYPFTVSLFDKDSELIETVTFTSDMELYVFIKNLTIEQIVNVGFPIVIINADQEEITINNLKELKNVIKEALDDDCDDDEDEDRFIETLTSEPLKIQKYKDDESNETKDFRGYTFDFAEDGTVIITEEGNTETIQGSWSLDDDDADEVSFDFGDAEPLSKLNGEWDIKKVFRTRIMLENRDSSDKTKDQLFFQQIK